MPLDGNGSFDPVFAEDKTYRPGELAAMRRFKWITPGFFHTMARPWLRGRDITWTDVYNKMPVW